MNYPEKIYRLDDGYEFYRVEGTDRYTAKDGDTMWSYDCLMREHEGYFSPNKEDVERRKADLSGPRLRYLQTTAGKTLQYFDDRDMKWKCVPIFVVLEDE